MTVVCTPTINSRPSQRAGWCGAGTPPPDSRGTEVGLLLPPPSHGVLQQIVRPSDSVPVGRIVGPEAMKHGWQRLNSDYAKQFGVEAQAWMPTAAQSEVKGA